MHPSTLPYRWTKSKVPSKSKHQSLARRLLVALKRFSESMIGMGRLAVNRAVLQGKALSLGEAGAGSMVVSEMQFRYFSDLLLFAHALRVFSGYSDLQSTTSPASTMHSYKGQAVMTSAKSSVNTSLVFLLLLQVLSSAVKYLQTTLKGSALVRFMGL